MVNLTDRQMQLYEILRTRQRISTEEIKDHFGISSATASRDIHALVVAGAAIKVSQGIKLAPPAELPFHKRKCFFCGHTLQERTLFILQMEDGSQRDACCGHCGLKALGHPGVKAALTGDFLSGRMADARQATYVMGSRIRPCCEPSVLGFANEEDAHSFQAGFGGDVYMLAKAIAQLKAR